MADRVTTLSDAIDLGLALHDEEVAERLRRREERNRDKLASLNRQARGPAAPPAVETPPAPPEPAPGPRPEPVAVAPVPPAPVALVEAPPAPAERAITPVSAPRPRPERPPVHPTPTAAPVPAQTAGRAETLPSERFVKVRNAAIDRLPRYVKGNRYTIYQYLYRNTLGRRHASPEANFTCLAVAAELGLAEKTVRSALKVLHATGLIELHAMRGSHAGVRVRMLDLEDALGQLEGGISSVTSPDDDRQKLPMTGELIGKFDRDSSAPDTEEEAVSSVTVTGSHEERHETHGNTHHGGAGVVDLLVERYGFTPERARAQIAHLAPADVALVPRLCERLDGEVAGGRIKNPAGLLVRWLEAFDTWRPVLTRPAADGPAGDEAPARTVDETTRLARAVAHEIRRANPGVDDAEVARRVGLWCEEQGIDPSTLDEVPREG